MADGTTDHVDRQWQAVRRQVEQVLGEGSLSTGPAPAPADVLALLRRYHDCQAKLEAEHRLLRRRLDELEESRDRYTQLYDFAPVGFVSLDGEGRIIQSNLTFAAILGQVRSRLLGRVLGQWVPPEHQPAFRSHLDAVTHRRRHQQSEFPLVRPDGQWVWGLWRSWPMTDKQGGIVATRTAMTDIGPLKRAQAALEDLTRTLEQKVAERTALAEQRTQELQLMTLELVQVEQQERLRLRQVLHDHLQQVLVAMRYQVELLGRQAKSPAAAGMLDDLYRLAGEAIETTRSLATGLSPPVLEQSGLSAALDWLALWLQRTHGLEVEVRGPLPAEPVCEHLRTLAFFAVRELLLNVAKHAGVSRADVTAQLVGEHEICLTVADDGRGFDPASLTQTRVEGGVGLASLRDRLRRLGGQLTVDSAPGRGCRIDLHLPLRGSYVADAHPGVPRPLSAPVPAPPTDALRLGPDSFAAGQA